MKECRRKMPVPAVLVGVSPTTIIIKGGVFKNKSRVGDIQIVGQLLILQHSMTVATLTCVCPQLVVRIE